jgi:hypothetical protein
MDDPRATTGSLLMAMAVKENTRKKNRTYPSAFRLFFYTDQTMSLPHPVFAQCATLETDAVMKDTYVAMSHGMWPFCGRGGAG